MNGEEIKQSEVSYTIENMLKRGNLNAFSVIRVESDSCSHSARLYLQNLEKVMKSAEIPFQTVTFPESLKTQIYIIGSKGDAKEETSRLIEIVGQCPEGPVLEGIKEDYLEHWCNEKELPQELKEIEGYNKGKKGLFIAYGPVFYNRNQLKDIKNLFTIPTLEYISCSIEDN